MGFTILCIAADYGDHLDSTSFKAATSEGLGRGFDSPDLHHAVSPKSDGLVIACKAIGFGVRFSLIALVSNQNL
jgi:hypothetical protein